MARATVQNRKYINYELTPSMTPLLVTDQGTCLYRPEQVIAYQNRCADWKAKSSIMSVDELWHYPCPFSIAHIREFNPRLADQLEHRHEIERRRIHQTDQISADILRTTDYREEFGDMPLFKGLSHADLYPEQPSSD